MTFGVATTDRPGSGGGGGVSVHSGLTGRDAAESHPIGAITDLQAELAALAAADWTPLGYVVSGDVTISTLETALDGDGYPDGVTFSIGVTALVSTGAGVLAMYPKGTVTGGDPGLYEWDGVDTLTFVRSIEPGDLWISSGVMNGSAEVIGKLGAIGQTLEFDLGSGNEPVIGTASDAAVLTAYDNTTSGLAAEQVQDAIDELRASGITPVDAGSNLSTARPTGVGVIEWLFDNGTDVGASGENIVNAEFGDLWAVAAS